MGTHGGNASNVHVGFVHYYCSFALPSTLTSLYQPSGGPREDLYQCAGGPRDNENLYTRSGGLAATCEAKRCATTGDKSEESEIVANPSCERTSGPSTNTTDAVCNTMHGFHVQHVSAAVCISAVFDAAVSVVPADATTASGAVAANGDSRDAGENRE